MPPILQFSKMCLQDNLADCADCGGLCPGLARFGKLVGLVEQSKHLIFMLYLSKVEMKDEKTSHTKILMWTKFVMPVAIYYCDCTQEIKYLIRKSSKTSA